eukprot:6186869-Pleurochrysis_carterae.AAC.1
MHETVQNATASGGKRLRAIASCLHAMRMKTMRTCPASVQIRGQRARGNTRVQRVRPTVMTVGMAMMPTELVFLQSGTTGKIS